MAKVGTNAYCIKCWPNLEPILVASPGGHLFQFFYINVPNMKQEKWINMWTAPNAIRIGSIFGHQMVLTCRWRHLHYLQNCPPDGAICISCKFGQQMAPLALVPNLATRWRYLHWLQIWPQDGTTCISYKFSYQVESLALVAKLSTRWRHLH